MNTVSLKGASSVQRNTRQSQRNTRGSPNEHHQSQRNIICFKETPVSLRGTPEETLMNTMSLERAALVSK
jgi:hypothetical protein